MSDEHRKINNDNIIDTLKVISVSPDISPLTREFALYVLEKCESTVENDRISSMLFIVQKIFENNRDIFSVMNNLIIFKMIAKEAKEELIEKEKVVKKHTFN